MVLSRILINLGLWSAIHPDFSVAWIIPCRSARWSRPPAPDLPLAVIFGLYFEIGAVKMDCRRVERRLTDWRASGSVSRRAAGDGGQFRLRTIF
jgi:hypothetical protein